MDLDFHHTSGYLLKNWCVHSVCFSRSCGSFCGLKTSATFIKQFTFCAEVFPPQKIIFCIFMFKPRSAVIYSILIERKQACLKSLCWTTTALHFICVFILPPRGPLFMDNWRTQIIIPLKWKICFYYLQTFAMPLCTLTLPSDCLFIIPEFLLSQWGAGQFQKVPSLYPAFSCLWHHCVFL